MKTVRLALLVALPVLLAGCGIAEAEPATTPTVCDPSVARAYPDGRDGVAVYVNTPGPDSVWVEINGATKNDHRLLRQQLTKRSGGAEFDFWNLIGFKADSIMVRTNAWSCGITPPPAL